MFLKAFDNMLFSKAPNIYRDVASYAANKEVGDGLAFELGLQSVIAGGLMTYSDEELFSLMALCQNYEVPEGVALRDALLLVAMQLILRDVMESGLGIPSRLSLLVATADKSVINERKNSAKILSAAEAEAGAAAQSGESSCVGCIV
ncbi:MAG: hypothetical protein GJ680_07535 [Alteromonadaceae bacterium]|nr:hypothetical protein [Alteromonadaceae bacterium]